MSIAAGYPQSRERGRSDAPDFGVIGLLLLGVLVAIPLPGGTSLFVGEPLLLLVMFMALRYRAPAFRHRDTTIILALGLTFFAVQVATDIFRDTPSADFSRGWARFIFFYAAFCSFTVLFTTRLRMLVTVCAFSAGAIVTALAMPSAQQVSDVWKFGLATPITYGSIAVLGLFGVRRRWYALALMTLAATDLLLGFRSQGLVSAAAAVTVIALARDSQWRSPTRRSLIKLAVAGCIAITAFSYVYVWAASSGRLGSAAQMKYEDQSGGRAGILLGARPELLASLYAIRESPLVGWGSWPLDTRGFTERARSTLVREGYTLQPGSDAADRRIPIHSYLFGAWVEGGVAATVFWIAVLAAAGGCLLAVIRSRFKPTTPLAILIVYSLGWDVLFSPFGAERRILTALLLASLLFIKHEPESPK